MGLFIEHPDQRKFDQLYFPPFVGDGDYCLPATFLSISASPILSLSARDFVLANRIAEAMFGMHQDAGAAMAKHATSAWIMPGAQPLPRRVQNTITLAVESLLTAR